MDNAEKKTYGLFIPKKNRKIVSTTNVFGDDNEDSQPSRKLVSLSLLKENNSKVKRDTQIEIDKALSQDPNIYDYDGVYDSMKADKAQAAGKSTSKDDKAPKYIQHLMKAAETRKRNQEKLNERKVQKEREAEGDEFADKEVFVTGAYKQKMQEMQELEKEEKKRAEMEAKMDVTKQNDLSGFYRHLLDQTAPVAAVKEEKTIESKVPEVIKTEPKEQTQTCDSTSTDNTNGIPLAKLKGLDEENHAQNTKADSKPHHDTSETINNKIEMVSDNSSKEAKNLSSNASLSKGRESKESVVRESSREHSKTDQKKKSKKEKLHRSPSSSSSESSPSDSERRTSTQKKHEKYSKFEHSRRKSHQSRSSSSSETSDSDSSGHSRERHRSLYEYSRQDAKHRQNVKEPESKSRATERLSSKDHRAESDRRKHENKKLKPGGELTKSDVFPIDNEKCKESVEHGQSTTSKNKLSDTTKPSAAEKRDLKRENDIKCEKEVTNKYARRTTEEEIKEAKARYLARKLANRR